MFLKSNLESFVAAVFKLQTITARLDDELQSVFLHPLKSKHIEDLIAKSNQEFKGFGYPPKICGIGVYVNDRLPQSLAIIKALKHTYLLDFENGEVREMFAPKELFYV